MGGLLIVGVMRIGKSVSCWFVVAVGTVCEVDGSEIGAKSESVVKVGHCKVVFGLSGLGSTTSTDPLNGST